MLVSQERKIRPALDKVIASAQEIKKRRWTQNLYPSTDQQGNEFWQVQPGAQHVVEIPCTKTTASPNTPSACSPYPAHGSASHLLLLQGFPCLHGATLKETELSENKIYAPPPQKHLFVIIFKSSLFMAINLCKEQSACPKQQLLNRPLNPLSLTKHYHQH